jgi:hypothetical protein
MQPVARRFLSGLPLGRDVWANSTRQPVVGATLGGNLGNLGWLRDVLDDLERPLDVDRLDLLTLGRRSLLRCVRRGRGSLVGGGSGGSLVDGGSRSGGLGLVYDGSRCCWRSGARTGISPFAHHKWDFWKEAGAHRGQQPPRRPCRRPWAPPRRPCRRPWAPRGRGQRRRGILSKQSGRYQISQLQAQVPVQGRSGRVAKRTGGVQRRSKKVGGGGKEQGESGGERRGRRAKEGI